MKNSFKKLVSLLTVLVMAVALVAVPNVSAKAAESGKISFVNAYDWSTPTAGPLSAYAFVSTDTTQNVQTMTGQANGVFEWWTYIVLDQNADGNYEVTAVYAPAAENDGDAVALQQGRIVIMLHANCTDTDSYAFFTSLTSGTVLSASATWDDMAAKWEAMEVTFTVVEDTAADEGATDEPAIKDTGDNFVPMFVVLFAGLAMVTVATVARKRNA